jgi:ABC-2 type transport system ATP-binding protein
MTWGTSNAAVEAAGLSRVYSPRGGSSVTALDRLDLRVERGEVHGLLGPNGAGKTTLCKILSTVLLPTAGKAEVCGFNVVTRPRQVRERIGVVFGGDRGLYTRLTARENLRYWSALYRQPRRDGAVRAEALLDRVGLSDRGDDRVQTFSRGMKQRLHLARGLIGDPEILILDEPTAGLDPVAAREFRVLVKELSVEGRTLLMATHDMAEAEAVCDRVSLIDAGRLLGTEDPRTIGTWMRSTERIRATGVPEISLTELRQIPGVVSVTASDDPRTVVIETAHRDAALAVLTVLVRAGVSELSTQRPSLAEVYLQVIGDRKLAIR